MKTIKFEKVRKFPRVDGFTGDPRVEELVDSYDLDIIMYLDEENFLEVILTSDNESTIYWSDVDEDEWSGDYNYKVSLFPPKVIAAKMEKAVIKAEEEIAKKKR